MTGEPNDTAVQQRLDKHYPFLEQGAELPGGYKPDARLPGSQSWQGQVGWRTRHGEAVVFWDLGRPSSVHSARYPDGSRGKVSYVLDHGFRRQAAGPKRWIYGTIDIRPDDVLFTDGVQPVYAPPPRTDVPNLEADLARDDEFLSSLKEDRFARAVYVVFRNRSFLKGANEQGWTCGDREAARLVANLRGIGESYQDYFPHTELAGAWPDDRPQREATLREGLARVSRPIEFGFKIRIGTRVAVGNDVIHIETAQQAEEARDKLLREFQQKRPELERQSQEMRAIYEHQLAELERNPNGDVFEELRAHLTRLGWRTENERDREQARARSTRRKLAVLQELKELEGRSQAPAPEWTEEIRKRREARSGWVMGFRAGALDAMTPDEREVATGGVTRRLDDLALRVA